MTDDEQVRRLLAEARHTEPMPDDVAARLDGVLADLRDEPAVTPPTDDLDARRRRRTARSWLLAAAAVVVLGVGINQVDWSGMSAGGDDSGASASDAGGDSLAAEAEVPDPASPADRDALRWKRPRVTLTSAQFGHEVQMFRRTQPQRYAALASEAQADAPLDGGADYSAMCTVGSTGPGARVPVRYDGERAWLVFRKPQGETQVVDLYLCGTDRPARSITLPAP